MRQILDVSSIVYGGHYGNDKRINGFPIGGLHHLLGIINSSIGRKETSLCFDGSNIIKKELLPTYKSGRIPDFSVYAQIELAKEIFKECNIPFYASDKYEADDLIYSLCHYLSLVCCDDDITILSDDRDIACCVSPNISIQNVTSNGKCIDYDNYCHRVVNNATVPYNSILIWKLFYGDSSDNYKGVKLNSINAESLIKIWSDVCELIMNSNDYTSSYTANYGMFEAVVNDNLYDLPQEDKDELLKVGRIVFPYDVPEVMLKSLEDFYNDAVGGMQSFKNINSSFKFIDFDNININKFKTYCDALGVNRYRNYRRGIQESSGVQRVLDMLALKAKELSNGEFIVNHTKGKPVETSNKISISSMELPL